MRTEYCTPAGPMILEDHDIYTISGEGESGTRERYEGKQTARALRARLTKETAGGDRWAFAEIDGHRVEYDEMGEWLK